ncbi:MAG: hypothetical protein WBA54_13200, partial [Acidaminobacteraceae bacterium]
INVIVYYPNERFTNSLKELYSTLDLDYKLYVTYEEKTFEKLIESESKSVVFVTRDYKLYGKVEKVVYLSEERDEVGLYIYQPAISFLKSISDYTKKNLEKNIINILIPTGFNSDLKIVSSVIEDLSVDGSRTLLIDTNPCRDIHKSNWDFLTKEILNRDLNLSDIPYIDDENYYYIKPFNSFKDYYLNCNVYGKLLESLRELEGIDYIFFMHYLNDYKALAEIEKQAKLNIIMTYGNNSDKCINDSELDHIYSRKFFELIDCETRDSNVQIASSENLWASSKIHYKKFELSLLEEVSRC